MSGQWKLNTDVTGKATASGEIARWVAEPGTHVEAGESVVEISSGAASRPAPVAESRQTQAEKEQIAAANGQNALAQKLSVAQIQLAASLERVEHAKAKVASARTLVKRLIAGEKIPVPGKIKRTRASVTRANPEAARLDQARKRAQDAASEARSRASDAKSELEDAKKALGKTQKQADVAASALTKAEADFKAEKVTADVLQNARADADDAQASLRAAQTRADVAQRAYSVSQDKAMASENAVNAAQDAAHKAPVTREETTPVTAGTADEERYMTADQAATLVAEALRETKAAARQADRIHARVDDYQRQVRQTSQRVESASQGLQKAQQIVLDSVPRPQFTAARAPVSGTITWISRLAREVGFGQSVFGISQGKNGFLRFEDRSGAWKALHVGQTLNAASSPTASTTPVVADSSSPKMPASTGNSPSPIEPVAIPVIPAPTFSIRITRITPPAGEGEAAQIDAIRSDGSTITGANANTVQAELPLDALPQVPNAKQFAGPQPVIVPVSVVLPRDGSAYVAVVESPEDHTTQATLEWRTVTIERQTAFDVEIKSGLHEGERIVAQPILLLSELKPEQKSKIPVLLEASD